MSGVGAAGCALPFDFSRPPTLGRPARRPTAALTRLPPRLNDSVHRFLAELKKRNPSCGDDARRWIYVPYDQLSDGIGPLAALDPAEAGIVLLESSWKAARRPYHVQKLALILANQRHFALEQAERGVAVRYVASDRPYGETLRPLAEELGPLTCMEPAERELRVDLAPLVDDGLVVFERHDGWITDGADFRAAGKTGPPWRMDAFYRQVRRRTGWLMEEGKPVGGKFSFDAENRKPWKGEPTPPTPPRFEPDEVTREVGELVETRFVDHPGELDLGAIPATRDDAESLWRWALEECMESFGPYEDAMSMRSSGLFHTRISHLLNLHRLLPRRVVEDVIALDVPLSSREGFLRQVAGWREFVRHVHRETDGFRRLDGVEIEAAPLPTDAGWGRWRDESWAATVGRSSAGSNGAGSNGAGSSHGESTNGGEPDRTIEGLDGGALPTALDSARPLPAAFWGEESGLACLDHVVGEVWETGYSHHITRLMVLGNLATLLDLSARELADWFWVAYTDAYDWVVEPNVLGMATYSAGGVMTTKPYVSGAAYIDKMSDYCAGCRFDPKKNCPITRLYWAFLDRHAESFEGNHRMRLVLASLEKRKAEERAFDRAVFQEVSDRLVAGEPVRPDALEALRG